MPKQTIADIDLYGKTVLLRVDYNVQFDDSGEILDDHRLKESIPTIRALQDKEARIVICSHRGRPNGKFVDELRNQPVATHLSKLLGQEVNALDEAIGPEVKKAVTKLAGGEIVLLENVRFYEGEEVFLDEQDIHLMPNQFVMLVSNSNDKKSALARFYDYSKALKRMNGDWKDGIWGVIPSNKEQQFAFEMLMDPNVGDPLDACEERCGERCEEVCRVV